jgi:hypothetical protein
MDNPEKLETLGTQDTGQINLRENRVSFIGRGNWIIRRKPRDILRQ